MITKKCIIKGVIYNIGLKIKSLRKQKNITQQDLAEMLGVSFQAISRWENNITSPVITTLHVLANIFEITVNELLDVDVYKKEQDIKGIIDKNEEYLHTGEMENSIALLRNALKKYPNNFKIVSSLSYSLFGYYCAKDEERQYLLVEII